MKYFASLDADAFEEALEHVLANGGTFKPVQSLKAWDGVTGAYIMVFDEYRQFYIGQSNDIRSRIKKHWTNRKPFDRVLFGTKYDSIFPVDELRALDTTRIFAARSYNPYAVEARAENAADRRFCLNRMGGGVPGMAVMLESHIPRNRSHDVNAAPQTKEVADLEWNKVDLSISQAKSSQDPNLARTLAGMDLTICSVQTDGPPPYLWSRRDASSSAAANGELSVEEFARFLKLMGEKIIWPES
ncbi:GIY-YIG nuclease family protein [Arthrobacter sp. R-11]|uniref:GIY-YIG nuclease family protein n=1 Tax=Arthrobacter sp. R-11 TaxID=3404053 RepID=UPI003CF92743